MIEVARDGDQEEVESLLNDLAMVNGTDCNGQTALHWAARNGDTEMVDFLIKFKANVDIPGKKKRKSCPSSSSQRIAGTPQFIARIWAEIDAKDSKQRTLLSLAAKNGY